MDTRTASEIDISAILSTYVYMDEQNSDYANKDLNWILEHMPPEVKSTDNYQAVYNAVHAEGSTLGNMKLISQSMTDTDDSSGKMIIACAFQDTDGNVFVAYRGTGDGKWVDNGVGISQESSIMQQNAGEYFDQLVKEFHIDESGGRIIVTGHSKGGNEAQYVLLASEYGYLIDNCYSLDGQGFSKAAIAAFIEKHGEEYYQELLNKMYSVNGENDYVHDLGIKVIPEDHTYIVNTGANSADGHSLLVMYDENGLKWTMEDGAIVHGEQGVLGKLAAVLSDNMQNLNDEDLEDCAIVVMSLLECLMPYHDETGEKVLGGQYKVGTGDKLFASGEEFIGFVAHGLPLLAETLLLTTEGRAFLMNALESGLSTLYNNTGVFGTAATLFIVAILAPTIIKVLGGAVIIANIFDMVTDFIDKIRDVSAAIKRWASELKDAFWNVIRGVSGYLTQLSYGGRYAAANPQIKVDTYKLSNYASRIQDVNRRIRNLDYRLDSLYWKVGLLDLWNLMQADLLTSYSWRLLRCSSYLLDTARDFENAETTLIRNL